MITKQLDILEPERAGDDFVSRATRKRVIEAERAQGCTNPIRLNGSIDVKDQNTGRRLYSWSSQRDELNGTVYVPCKTRRADKCESCSKLYQGDAYRLLVDGLRGGEFVPENVKEHSALFVTFTAPSFGVVHRHAEDAEGNPLPCHPRRKGEVCPHGINFDCKARHTKDDYRVGQAMCPDCYDYDGAVIWNHFSGKLWRQTRIEIDKALAKVFKTNRTKMRATVARTEFAKVAEFQARGSVHFHVAIRLDGPDATKADASIDVLTQAIKDAHGVVSVASVDDERVSWGPQLDIGEITTSKRREKVAGYCAKYSTKSADAKGQLNTRIRDDRQIDYLPVNDHLARLVRAAWKLGNQAQEWIKAQPPKRSETGGMVRITKEEDHWRLVVTGGIAMNNQQRISRRFETRDQVFEFLRKLEQHHHPLENMTRWAHQFGFGGHFLTKSRATVNKHDIEWLGWSTTFKFLRQRRADHNAATRRASWEALSSTGELVIEARWEFAGAGFANPKDAHLAALHRAQRKQATQQEEAAA